MHTLLLDPTAATVWGDSFPAYKTSDYAININDEQKFIDSLGVGLTTVSDENITGYQNIRMTGTTHTDITEDWLISGVQDWIRNIILLKDSTTGTFSREEDIAQKNN